jgi:hypothetical protein
MKQKYIVVKSLGRRVKKKKDCQVNHQFKGKMKCGGRNNNTDNSS